MITWTKEKEEQLREFYLEHSLRECATLFNTSYQTVKSRVDKLKLKHAAGYKRMQHSMSALLPEEITFIKENYLKYPNPVLSKMMGRGESTLLTWARKLKINGKVNTGRIQPGNIPRNKGKKMPPGWGTEGMKRTQFKKGSIPKNTKTDGHITLRNSHGRSYFWIRIKKKTLAITTSCRLAANHGANTKGIQCPIQRWQHTKL
jgi:hypothetical protein